MKGSALTLDADGKKSRLDKDIVPASFWNPEFLRHAAVLDPQDGRVAPITVVDGGLENLTVGNRTLQAHHYTVKGRIHRTSGMTIGGDWCGSRSSEATDRSSCTSRHDPGPRGSSDARVSLIAALDDLPALLSKLRRVRFEAIGDGEIVADTAAKTRHVGATRPLLLRRSLVGLAFGKCERGYDNKRERCQPETSGHGHDCLLHDRGPLGNNGW